MQGTSARCGALVQKACTYIILGQRSVSSASWNMVHKRMSYKVGFRAFGNFAMFASSFRVVFVHYVARGSSGEI